MFAARVAVCTLAWIFPLLVCAQDYPTKTVRIVTTEAGGGSDVATRIIAQGLAPGFGQPVIVDNRGGGVIAGETVAKSPPDGYTLLFNGNTLWLLPLMRSKMPYDTAKDFAPVTLAFITPTLLVVHPSLPVRSVRELTDFVKSRPGQLNYSTAATGTGNHLAAELFKHMAGLDMVRIPYKGHASALNAVMGGETQVFFPIVGLGMAQVKAGRLRALAVTSALPSPQAPGVATLAASGLPGYEAILILGFFAPTATPAAIIDRLNRDIVQVLQRPDIRDRLFAVGLESVGSSPQEFATAIKKEVAVMGKVIREANIRDE